MDRISNHHKVLQIESHGATDWHLILLTKYKDMGTMEANEARENACIDVWGNDEKQRQGCRERLEIHEVIGGRLARDIVLEPRR